MTDSLSTPPSEVPASGSNNRRRNIIIAVVVGLLVLCCCCLLILLPLAWSCGDVLMGIASECSPLFP